jgi:hypothetical protein
MQGFFALIGTPPAPSSHMRQSVLDRLAPAVRKDFERLTGSHHTDLLTAHEAVETIPAQFKRRLVVKALKQPWDGLTDLERQGLLLAEVAVGGSVNLPALLDVLEAGMDRTSTFYKPVPLPTSSAPEDLLGFMVGSLEQASLHREKALTNLTETERHLLFLHAQSMAEHFIPQISSLSDQTTARVKADLRFAELLEEQVDYAGLIAAAQVLARLANERWLHQVTAAWTKPLPASAVPPGVTGDVLLVQETSYGLILIGGPGPNTYELDKRFGLIIDVGGKDLYRGMIAASADENQGNAVVIDLNGDDTYDGAPLGLATGRLGVGLLIDHAGDDHYQCGDTYPSAYNAQDALTGKPGDPLYQYDCFGLGAGSGQRILTKKLEWQAYSLAGGWGLLLDIEGHDHYDSANFSQGQGYFFGAGMKLDLDGDDEHQAARYGHGASAHFGVGLFIDRHGDDRYGSSGPFYNGGVAWDSSVSLMIDAGKGRDIYAFDRSTGLGRADYAGWGLFIDEGGADQYQAKTGFGDSSEKSVAGFFDLAGKDTYTLPPDSSIPADTRPSDGRLFFYPQGGVFVDR